MQLLEYGKFEKTLNTKNHSNPYEFTKNSEITKKDYKEDEIRKEYDKKIKELQTSNETQTGNMPTTPNNIQQDANNLNEIHNENIPKKADDVSNSDENNKIETKNSSKSLNHSNPGSESEAATK